MIDYSKYLIDDPQTQLVAIENEINSLLKDLHYTSAMEATSANSSKLNEIGDEAKDAYEDLKEGLKEQDQSKIEESKSKLSKLCDKFNETVKRITASEEFDKAKKVAAILAAITAAIIILQAGRKGLKMISENKSVLSRGEKWGETHINDNGRKFATWTGNERNENDEIVGKNEMLNRCYKTSDLLKSTLKKPFSSNPTMYDKGLKEVAGFERKTTFNDGSTSVASFRRFGDKNQLK